MALEQTFSLELKITYNNGSSKVYPKKIYASDEFDAVRRAELFMKEFKMKGYFRSVKDLVYSIRNSQGRSFYSRIHALI